MKPVFFKVLMFSGVAIDYSFQSVSNLQEKGQYYALAIGFCVIAGAYGAGVISGGAFNPAVAFSLDVTSALGAERLPQTWKFSNSHNTVVF